MNQSVLHVFEHFKVVFMFFYKPIFWLVSLYVNLSLVNVFAFLSSLKYKICQCKIKYKIFMYAKEYANVHCTSMHMCKYANVQKSSYAIVRMWKCASMQMCKSANVQLRKQCQCESMPMCKYVNVQVGKCASMQMGKYANVQVCKRARLQMCKSYHIISYLVFIKFVLSGSNSFDQFLATPKIFA